MDDSTESSGQFVEDPYFQTALPGPWRHKDWQPGSERIAYGPDTASLGRSQQRPQRPGEHMRVLVRVEVRNRDAGRLKPTNLSCGFGFDLFPLEAAEERALGETTQTVAKSCAIFAVRVHEGRHLRSVQNRRTINQDHVAADAQLRGASGLLHRVLKGGPIGHQSGGRHHTLAVRLYNGAIDTRGEAKVVSIDNEAAHAAIVAPWGCAGCASRFDRDFQRRVYSKASLFLKNPLGLRVLLVCRKRLSAARGRLAQLVRARALQARGRRFEPCTAHQFGFGASPGT